MATNYKSPIEELVDQMFNKIKGTAKRGDLCHNPVTGGCFVWGLDPIAPQKTIAVAALRAREWFAAEGGPLGAPPLPLSNDEIEDYQHAQGLKRVIGFYADSLDDQDFDYRKHPSFEDFARGLMAINTGLWRIEKDPQLRMRFPPRPLAGMTPSAYWAPPKEYKEIMASYRREQKAA
jgi:hypothetical protein